MTGRRCAPRRCARLRRSTRTTSCSRYRGSRPIGTGRSGRHRWTSLATLPAEIALERVTAALKDEDRRVIPAVLRALVRLRAPDAAAVLLAHLKEADYVIRETAATLLKDMKPEGGLAALREAYEAGQPDSAYGARAAAIDGPGRIRRGGARVRARGAHGQGLGGTRPRRSSCSRSSSPRPITGSRSVRRQARRPRPMTMRPSPRRRTRRTCSSKR